MPCFSRVDISQAVDLCLLFFLTLHSRHPNPATSDRLSSKICDGPQEWRRRTCTHTGQFFFFFCDAPQTATFRTLSAALKKLNINYCNFRADYIRQSRPSCKVQPGTRLDLLHKSLKTQERHFSNFNGITSLIFEALEEERVFGL